MDICNPPILDSNYQCLVAVMIFLLGDFVKTMPSQIQNSNLFPSSYIADGAFSRVAHGMYVAIRSTNGPEGYENLY